MVEKKHEIKQIVNLLQIYIRQIQNIKQTGTVKPEKLLVIK